MASPYQRSLNSASPLHPRNGSPKVLTTPATVGKRQTPDSVFTGPGQTALDDEPNLPLKAHTKPTPVHAGMSAAQKAKFEANPANDPDAILQNAANLGRVPSAGEKA